MKIENKKGFTLVELVIVIALLVVIAGIFTVSLIKSIGNQKDEESKDMIAQIVSAANAYVSVNPDKIEDLFNGYGYVDIPIGTLRDKGFLKEDVKDPHTGKRIPDDEKVRVKLDLGDYLDFKYPVDKDQENLDAWKFIAEDLYVDFSSEDQDWCDNEDNIYIGLIQDPEHTDYEKFKSKLYLMNNKEGDPDEARMFTGDYFDTSEKGVNLRVTSCNVNPSKVGTYNITYKYYDDGLGTEKTVNRVVYVNSSNEDIMGFTVVINKGQPIVRGTPEDEVPILIKEIYRNGAKDIPTTVGELVSIGYEIADFKVDVVGDSYIAIVKRVVPNSDGSLPNPQKPEYKVIPDTYTLTFNAGNGTVSPKDKIVTYKKPYGEMPTPTRTGYDFIGWFTESGAGDEVTSETIMMNLFDHILYARWKPKVFTVNFDGNGGTVNQSSMQVTYDSTYGSMPTATKPGYDFAGWYTSASGGNLISSGTVVQILANQTLYAHWTPATYTITYNSNGCGNVSQSTKNVSYDSTYGVMPSASRGGYTFNGWSSSPSGNDRVDANSKISGEHYTSMSNKNITLYAQCTQNPTPHYPSYEPSYDRPGRGSSSGGSSGSSSTKNTNTSGGCFGGGSGSSCSMEWRDAEKNGTLNNTVTYNGQKMSLGDALHAEAQKKYSNENGGGTRYDDSTGMTYDKNGNRVSPAAPSSSSSSNKGSGSSSGSSGNKGSSSSGSSKGSSLGKFISAITKKFKW